MKKMYLFIGTFAVLTSCHDLDMNPLSNGSTENWYSSAEEVRMAVNDLYRMIFWPEDGEWQTDWSDDYTYRETLTSFENATLNGQNSNVTELWKNQYKAIARANSIIHKYQRAIDKGANAVLVRQYVAEARFHRACAYSKLIQRFGDVPLVEDEIDIEQGLGMGRTDKATVLKLIYDDFDKAVSTLPVSYNGEQRATKGAALSMKARIALYENDYSMAVTAAKACMDLGVYSLESDYARLFLQSTKKSDEFIFIVPRSIEYNQYVGTGAVRNDLIRNAGGWAATDPSWDLLASYECIDGLPIDESPLFDSHDPFKNRDPRLAMTIQPFGKPLIGYEYNPRPDAVYVMNYNTGTQIKNNDSRVNAQYASFNGLVWCKGVDASWTENGYTIEPLSIVMRYADVLLMYAEAKIELNQIDESVIDAINTVKARAYGVGKSAVDRYPAVAIADQAQMRVKLRTERRMEFAKEHRRYTDVIRWRIARRVYTHKNYGMLYPSSILQEKVVDTNNWFWPFAPDIDEEGIPDFTKMEATGLIQVLSQRLWDDRQYLWPIPTSEIQINKYMTPNPGY